jgi:DNA replication protein DnaD
MSKGDCLILEDVTKVDAKDEMEWFKQGYYKPCLTLNDRVVLSCIHIHVDLNGREFPSANTIAEELAMDIDEVLDSLMNLMTHEIIEVNSDFLPLRFDRETFPSIDVIAEELGISTSEAQQSLTDLVNEGFMEIGSESAN